MMLIGQIQPASVQDRHGTLPVLAKVRRLYSFIEKIFADGAYQGAATAAAVAKIGAWDLEIVKRSDTTKGFVVLPKRWIVERTLSWIGHCRRLSKHVENLAISALAFLRLAMIRLMMRRIAQLQLQQSYTGQTLRLDALGPAVQVAQDAVPSGCQTLLRCTLGHHRHTSTARSRPAGATRRVRSAGRTVCAACQVGSQTGDQRARYCMPQKLTHQMAITPCAALLH
jgi:transposase